MIDGDLLSAAVERAQAEWCCELNPTTVGLVVENLFKSYRPGVNFEERIELFLYALEKNLTEAEWHGYKCAIGILFSATSKAKHGRVA
jgi:hypothetical protein